MARTHGKILCSIWQDEEFRHLTPEAQRLYLAIISQPKLNLVGLLDYFPDRLARLSDHTDVAHIDKALAALEADRYILVDATTSELLVRSFTRNDPIPFGNPKLRKGVWSAWLAIESSALRREAVYAMPDDLFGTPETPAAASQVRRSDRIEYLTDSVTDSPIADYLTDSVTDSPPPPPPPPPMPIPPPRAPADSSLVDNPGPTPALEPDLEMLVDLEHRPPPTIEPDQRQANLERIAELKRHKDQSRPT